MPTTILIAPPATAFSDPCPRSVADPRRRAGARAAMTGTCALVTAVDRLHVAPGSMQSPHGDTVRPTRAAWPTTRRRPRLDRPRAPAAVWPTPHGPSGTPTREAYSSRIRP